MATKKTTPARTAKQSAAGKKKTVKKATPARTAKRSVAGGKKTAKKATKKVVKKAVKKEVKKEEKKILPGHFSGEYIYAVGRRKTAVAQVRLYKYEGEITDDVMIVNGRPMKVYFPTDRLQAAFCAPLVVSGMDEKFAISALVRGGGQTGQVDAIKLAIARALIKHDADFRPALKAQGLLTRDARKVERKKPGLRKARKSPQWAKR